MRPIAFATLYNQQNPHYGISKKGRHRFTYDMYVDTSIPYEFFTIDGLKERLEPSYAFIGLAPISNNKKI